MGVPPPALPPASCPRGSLPLGHAWGQPPARCCKGGPGQHVQGGPPAPGPRTIAPPRTKPCAAALAIRPCVCRTWGATPRDRLQHWACTGENPRQNDHVQPKLCPLRQPNDQVQPPCPLVPPKGLLPWPLPHNSSNPPALLQAARHAHALAACKQAGPSKQLGQGSRPCQTPPKLLLPTSAHVQQACTPAQHLLHTWCCHHVTGMPTPSPLAKTPSKMAKYRPRYPP